jgi:predicted SAM-dependent methyltransferase
MIFEYKGKIYPKYIKDGDAIGYIIKFAQYFLKGDILDIGGTKEWHFPGATIINSEIDDEYHAMNLPDRQYDGIISSHCLEHLDATFEALKYWTEKLIPGGCLFLYLPHPEMRYWSMDNDKHKHIFEAHRIKYMLEELGYKNIITSERDLYYSFSVIGWKK